MKKALGIGVLFGVVILSLVIWRTKLWTRLLSGSSSALHTSLTRPASKSLPLLQYTIPHLRQGTYPTSAITVEKKIADFPGYSSYVFSFETLGKKMTGRLNVPTTKTDQAFPIIILVRGYVPPEIYQPGVGTQPAAAVFAAHGYVTFAPDFFSYGGSDPETSDTWAARFQKPISVVELITSVLAQSSIQLPADQSTTETELHLDPQRLGMWAHSNGGQIALTTLEILNRPIPTSLWAPVTAPFPYSVLYFSDEDPDEGKATRAFIAQFEKDYDATQFSLTDFLGYLHSPLQIQQGLQDESIHYTWSQKFVDKLKRENLLRKIIVEQKNGEALNATEASIAAQLNLSDHPYNDLIPVTFYTFPGTDHNMQPAWNTAVQHDLEFFAQNLK